MARLSACLQRFGEVLVGSASIVFGPSAQCWNAISSVLSAVQKYQALFDGFIALMERTSGFLDRVTVFLQDAPGGCFLAPNLRRATYQILGHFLKVLANAHRVAHSRKEKLRLFAGVVMFADDGGVKADLDHLDRLTQNLLHTEVEEMGRDIRGIDRFLQDSERARRRHEAEMSQSAQRSEARLDDVHGSLSRAKLVHDLEVSEQAHQSHLGTIRESLFTGGVQRSQDTHKALRSSRLAGTGKWLLQNPVFQRWSDPDELELELMTLVGQAGYGKSHICSHVIDHLSTRSAPCQVAYYYFSKEPSHNSLKDCLGSLIFQIAKFDNDYAQSTAQACHCLAGLTSVDALWSEFVAGLHQRTPRMYYLVIDDWAATGLGPEATALLERLVSKPLSCERSSNVRVFLTMDDNAAQARGAPVLLGRPQLQSFRGFHITQLQTEPHAFAPDDGCKALINREDLELLVDQHVNVLCRDPDFRDLVTDQNKDVVSDLVEGTRGDYLLLCAKLKELEA